MAGKCRHGAEVGVSSRGENGNTYEKGKGRRAIPCRYPLFWRLTLEKALARNLAAPLADETTGIQPDPVVPAAGSLLFLFVVQRPAPAEALNDHGAYAKEHGEEAGIEPSEIHRRTSAPSFGLIPPCAHRTPQS